MTRDMVFGLVGGLGLFIYGMRVMGDGLQKWAGEKLRRVLEMLTTNALMGVLLGALVTALIQSSSATTVMVVGFVNAGLMTLRQAAGVIMGANIGTTVTAQLIAFRLTEYALPSVAVGVALYSFGRRRRHKHLGQILLGFGLLFLGMGMMSSAVKPLRSMPAFTQATVALSRNPLLGVLVGFATTSVIQSSSATIGILQALAGQGLVSLPAALPILFGDNIGTCVTALLSSIGASITARRAAFIHLFFNIIGTCVFLILLPVIVPAVEATSLDPVRQIANAHTMFNVVNTALQIPFVGLLVGLVCRVIPGQEPVVLDRKPKYLDRRLLNNPSIAMSQVVKELLRMGELALETLSDAMQAFFRGDRRLVEQALEKEKVVNELERATTVYLVALSQRALDEVQSRRLNVLHNVVNDIERIGDHAENIAELADYKIEHRLPFSPQAIEGLRYMYGNVSQLVRQALECLRSEDDQLAQEVIAREVDVDNMEKELRSAHIKRLNEGKCYPGSGVVFLDIISNLERIGDHACSIAHVMRGE